MRSSSNRRAFSLTEVLVSAVIMLLAVLAIWAFYTLGLTWWHETTPRVDAQRTARIALDMITDGVIDPTTGADIAQGVSYSRRNGIAHAYFYPPDLAEPYVNEKGQTVYRKINYGLYADYANHPPQIGDPVRNIRSFYLGQQTGYGGLKAVYYNDGVNSHIVNGTIGITNLEFSRYIDKDNLYGYGADTEINNIIVVRVTVDKDMQGTRPEPYTINVDYGYDDSSNLTCADTVYLRSVPHQDE